MHLHMYTFTLNGRGGCYSSVGPRYIVIWQNVYKFSCRETRKSTHCELKKFFWQKKECIHLCALMQFLQSSLVHQFLQGNLV